MRCLVAHAVEQGGADDVLFITAVEVLVIGLLADLIVAQRREPR